MIQLCVLYNLMKFDKCLYICISNTPIKIVNTLMTIVHCQCPRAMGYPVLTFITIGLFCFFLNNLLIFEVAYYLVPPETQDFYVM